MHDRILSAAMDKPLFDTRLITKNLERGYEAMWEVREMGIPASHIGERGGNILRDERRDMSPIMFQGVPARDRRGGG